MLTVGVQSAYWFSWSDPEGSMKRLRACGFNAVDFGMPGVPLTPDPPTSYYDKPLEEILETFRRFKKAADDNGIIFSQMHAPFPLWAKDREDFNTYMIMVMEKVCAVAGVLECPAIVAHPITRSTREKAIETNMDMYLKMAPFAKRNNTKLCLENLFTGAGGRITEGSCADADEACWYLDKLNEAAGAEVFGFCFDIGHANLVHHNVRWYLNKLGSRLICLHIQDNDGMDDLHHMPYTQLRYRAKCNLATDWEGFIEGLRDIGYDRTLSFETFRVLEITPNELWDSALTHIANIGGYFKKRIEAPKAEE